MSRNINLHLTVIFALIASGCSTTPLFYYKSGDVAHILSCSNNSWTKCMEHASAICMSSGYEILEKNTTRISGFFGYSDHREMIIKCNKPLQLESSQDSNNKITSKLMPNSENNNNQSNVKEEPQLNTPPKNSESQTQDQPITKSNDLTSIDSASTAEKEAAKASSEDNLAPAKQ